MSFWGITTAPGEDSVVSADSEKVFVGHACKEADRLCGVTSYDHIHECSIVYAYLHISTTISSWSVALPRFHKFHVVAQHASLEHYRV